MGIKRSKITFPVGGEDNSLAYQWQPPYTTPRSLNVRTREVFEDRGSGGTRPGLIKSHYTQLGGGSPIRLLASINSIQSDGFDCQFDNFDGTDLSSSWSVGQFSSLPTVEKIDGVNYVRSNGTPLRGMIASTSFVTDFTATAYRISLFVVPHQFSHQGTYQIHARMDASSPVSTTDGVILELVLSAGGAYGGTLYRYVSGVLTSHSLTGGTIGADLPGWFELDVSSSTTVKGYWQGNQLISQSVDAAVGNRWGLAMKGSTTDSKAIIETAMIQYTRSSKYEIARPRVFASSNGLFYRDSYLHHMEQVSSSLTLQSGGRVMCAELAGKLMIADWSYPLASATNGTNTATSFDSSTYSDWTALGISANDHGLQVFGDANADADAIPISSIASGNLTLSRTLKKLGTAANCTSVTFSVVRRPKYYDPATNTIAAWNAENYAATDPGVQMGIAVNQLSTGTFSQAIGTALIGTAKGIVPYGCRILVRAMGRIFLSGDPTAPAAWFCSREGNPFDWDYGVVDDEGAAYAGTSGEIGVVPEPITALVPWIRQYLLIGCRNSLWLLNGNPRGGGVIAEVARGIGIVDATAHCVGPNYEVYMLGRDGLYFSDPACATCRPKQASRGPVPRELLDVSSQDCEVYMKYDIRNQGVLISIVYKNSRAGVKHWFFDTKNRSFHAERYPATMEPTSMFQFAGIDGKDDCVLLGGRDGRIRRHHKSSGTDDGTSITNYAYIGPLRLGDWLSDGKVTKLAPVMAESSGSATLSLHLSDTPENALNATAFPYSMPLVGGLNRVYTPNAGGNAGFLKITGSGTRPFAMQEIAMEIQPNVGPHRGFRNRLSAIVVVTYNANGGTWLAKTGGTSLAYDASESAIAAAFHASYGGSPEVETVINSTTYTHTITFTDGLAKSVVPVDNLYLSSAGTAALTVTTQGVTEAFEQFNLQTTPDGIGDYEFELVFAEGTVNITADHATVTSADIQSQLTSASIPVTVSGFGTTNSPDTMAFNVTYNTSGNKTNVTVGTVAKGTAAIPGGQYVNGVTGVAEVTSLNRGLANFGSMTVSGAVIPYDRTNAQVATLVAAATGRSFTAGSGIGTAGSPWILTDTTTGSRTDLAVTVNELEIRITNTLGVETTQQGG